MNVTHKRINLSMLKHQALLILLAIFPNIILAQGPLSVKVDGRVYEATKQMPSEHRPTSNLCGDAVWHEEITNPGSEFIRIEFSSITDNTTENYRVVVYDYQFKERFIYNSDSFSREVSFWTGLIPGDTVIIEVCGGSETTQTLSFKVSRYIAQVNFPNTESIFGSNDINSVSEYASDTRVSSVQRSVAKLSYMKNNVPDSCTGTMISEKFLLTNHHCVSSKGTCKTAVAIFGYHTNLENAGQQSHCVKVVASNEELDFSVLELEGNPGQQDQWGHVRLCNHDLNELRKLFIVHHPDGTSKKITMKNCGVVEHFVRGGVTKRKTDFSHTCDTMGGSSGALVFDENAKIVGLHHLPKWVGKFAKVNRAVRIDKILEHYDFLSDSCTAATNAMRVKVQARLAE